MKKLMAVAMLLGMSFFAVEASAGPMNAKAAKKVFDGISRRAGTVVMGKRGAEHIYHEYRDYRDSVDREGLYLDRARFRNFDNQGHGDGSQSELFIRNPYASQGENALRNDLSKNPRYYRSARDSVSRLLEKAWLQHRDDEELLGKQYDNLDNIEARILESSTQIQETPEVSNMEPIQELDCGYSVEFLSPR